MISASIIQAVRGPLLLITLGALIVIDYQTHFKFNQTWPVLIIVFGVLKLMERMVVPAAEPFPPGRPPGVTPGGEPPPGYNAPPRNTGGVQS